MIDNRSGVPLRQFLTFTVADEEYGIDVRRVNEIFAFVPLTRVPRAPGFIAGVMNLRGTVVPVVDLRVKLGMPPTTTSSRTCIIIVEIVSLNGRTTMGLLSDEVRQVMDLAASDIESPPSFGTRIDLSFLEGMGDLGDHFALILNIDKVLSDIELIAASAAAVSASGARAAPVSIPKRSKRKRDATAE
jgi:purine-binding chemotaxis protein CheW